MVARPVTLSPDAAYDVGLRCRLPLRDRDGESRGKSRRYALHLG
ncbi:hypothetical protein HMPREF3214_00887 [Alloscardovia omnicolens]|nr:hypothetical protein HMPREF3214_00887 [Alloscardovia omnicolens]